MKSSSHPPTGDAASPGGDTSIVDLFREQVHRAPDAVAVALGGRQLTYRELNRRANQLAHHLHSLGVAKGSAVGLCLERSLDAIVGLYGIIKSGAAVVPLDPNYPQERLAYMLETADLRVLVTQSSLEATFSNLPSLKIVRTDSDAARISACAGDDPDPQPSASDLLYVIFTSGSTGRPKGVAMPHGPIVNLVRWQTTESSVLPSPARTLQFTTLSFDVAYQEIFSTGCSGGTLVLMTEELRYDSARLWEYLEQERIHRLFLPFVALQQLAEAACESRRRSSSLVQVITAGEQLQTTPQLRELFSRWTDARLHNHYGPSETHVATAFLLPKDVGTWVPLPSIGVAIANVSLRIVDGQNCAVPVGESGELLIGGACLARGYLNRPELTAERFVPDPISNGQEGLVYRTGDMVRLLPDGTLEFLGRIDGQVKIRGHRVELGEIESVLREFPPVRDCVIAAPGIGADRRLVAYVIPQAGAAISTSEVRAFLRQKLADYLLPSVVISLEKFPLTPSGKVDRRTLPEPSLMPSAQEAPVRTTPSFQSGSSTEKLVAEVWSSVLGIPEIAPNENFFDLGGHSLMLPRVQRSLRERLQREVSILDLLRFTTLRALSKHLDSHLSEGADAKRPAGAHAMRRGKPQGDDVAIVGMSGRFPGAPDIHSFWKNLCEGRESVKSFSDEELLNAGAPAEVLKDSSFVRSRCILDDVDQFDAGFFGINRRDAEQTDPQHRLFLECSWEALESAGHDPMQSGGSVGVYAGSSLNTYFLSYVLPDRQSVEEFTQSFQVDRYNVLVGNDKDYLATRVAYRLNLKGPAITIQTACSTSLVAVTQACAGLLSGQCDLALAGGVSISFPQERGYIYQEGAIASSDGHCRPFDADASGTVFGAGVAVVALKRLEDAVRDGNTIYAVIKGAAVNNDGSDKVSFTAPSVNGQAEVILAAQAQAGISADTLGYVEAHGTGTPLGDPIEVAALVQAFRASTDRKQFCRLGSVKGNVGHLEAAAGVTGLIKASLALHHGCIPPTVHFKTANPKCELESSPFVGVPSLTPWPREPSPRRAAVSSFGVGGTNAHVVLEEAPLSAPPPIEKQSGPQVLVMSARTPKALEDVSQRLADWLQAPEGGRKARLEDIAWTLQRGRKAFEHRRIVVATDAAEAADLLTRKDPKRVATSHMSTQEEPRVVFLFPGQGSQYVNMGKELYESEPVFRSEVDRCCSLLTPLLGVDLRSLLYPAAGEESAAKISLTETVHTQPALFVIEYALARLWMSQGVRPAALVGHSVGEFVAAVIADVLSLEDCLVLLSTRARLMQGLPAGSMLSVRLPESEVGPYLTSDVTVAVVNSPKNCVLSGPPASVERVRQTLSEAGIACKGLFTSHAFHSAMMDPMIPEFVEKARALTFRPPSIPIVSTLTGRWVNQGQPGEADWTRPEYWAQQLRNTVRFSEAITTLLKTEGNVLLEVGPGQTLATLAQQQPSTGVRPLVLASMPPVEQSGERIAFSTAFGRLWASGVSVDFQPAAGDQGHRLLALPGYPFERQRYWAGKKNSPSSPSPSLKHFNGTAIPTLSGLGVQDEVDSVTAQPSHLLVEEVIHRQLRLMTEQLDVIAIRSVGPLDP